MATVSYLVVLPKQLVAHSNTVALDFGREIWGPTGVFVFAIIVAFSCFGALNGRSASVSSLLILITDQQAPYIQVQDSYA